MDKKTLKEILEQALKLSPEKAREHIKEKIGFQADVLAEVRELIDGDEELMTLVHELLHLDCSKCGRKCR